MESHDISNNTITISMSLMEFQAYLEWRNGKEEKPLNKKKGLTGVMEVFLCSRAQACRIANSDWFQPAILYKEGKLMTFDADVAERLGKERIELKK